MYQARFLCAVFPMLTLCNIFDYMSIGSKKIIENNLLEEVSKFGIER